MTAETILLVDDEPSILKLGRMYLEQEGFQVLEAGDGEAALEVASASHPALVVLDLMLPKIDGFEVCRRLRTTEDDTAVLMLTARDQDMDKILGLELGADDYLTKPFNPRELVARVKAILRRVNQETDYNATPIHLDGLDIDPIRREVHVVDHVVDFRAQEFDLLMVLASQPGRVFTREQLLRAAWGIDYYGQTRTVDVHIGQLRRKLTGSAVRIETITGVGYKLTT